MTIKELKTKRDDLWSKLDKVVGAKSRDTEKEKQVRDEIKTIQQSLYKLEMTPVMYDLEKKLSEGSISDDKIEAAEKKLAILKEELND